MRVTLLLILCGSICSSGCAVLSLLESTHTHPHSHEKRFSMLEHRIDKLELKTTELFDPDLFLDSLLKKGMKPDTVYNALETSSYLYQSSSTHFMTESLTSPLFSGHVIELYYRTTVEGGKSGQGGSPVSRLESWSLRPPKKGK